MCTDNLKFSDVAMTLLNERYLQTDMITGVKETPSQMLKRVAKCVARGDKQLAKAFYKMMARLDFLPNSPTLMNAGRVGKQGQLAACYVLDVPDTMDGIFEALKKQALIHKSGGGTGFNFSKIRPKGSLVNTTGGIASGPLSFMELFDVATEKVMQGGMRRGANMGILNCDHPDVLDFIGAKRKPGVMSNFNISIGVTDDFMHSVINEADTRVDSEDKITASEIWEAIIESAWSTGDPGLIFLDAINRANTTPELGRLDATNPCGETPLYPNEACNLGSINLSNFVMDETSSCFIREYAPYAHFHKGRFINWVGLRATAKLAVEFLNNVIDVNSYPLPEIGEAVKRTRKIGLGVMGWADMLFKLGVPYNSQKALALASQLMKFINTVAKEASAGRNACVTCIAPTGSISLLAGCSSGIEPVFALSYDRVCFDKDEDSAGNSKRKVVTINNAEFQSALDDKEDARIEDGVFVTAHDIKPSWHVLMQATFQANTDLAVSKTVNLPSSATKEDISNLYIFAWVMNCKGITVYRDRCKPAQVLYYASPVVEDTCPQCGGKHIQHSGACKICIDCCWSQCAV